MLQRHFDRSANVYEEMVSVEQKYHRGNPTNGSANAGPNGRVLSRGSWAGNAR